MPGIILLFLSYFAIGFLLPVLGRRMIAAYPCCWHSYFGDMLKFYFRRGDVIVSRKKPKHNLLKNRYNFSKVMWGFLYMILFGIYGFVNPVDEVSVFGFIFLYLFGLAVYIDMKRQIIPDILTFGMLIFAVMSGDAELAIINALVVYILTSVLALAFYFRHPYGFGGGDVALLAAIAAFIGLEATGFAIVFGSILMTGWCAWKKQRAAPLAPFVFAGVILWLFAGEAIKNML